MSPVSAMSRLPMILPPNSFTITGLSELFLVGGCVKKVGGCDELKTEREGGLHFTFLH